ncbi:MAG: hypothetical protein LBV79_12315 [Candidatus Adiutrix sp.]|jgi:hypothetical protein|nr:hypothetical protein [Candidatus Adiutrix sp.]
MFKKFARLQNRAERLEIYNILKFNINACLKLVELLLLTVMVAGFAWMLSAPLMRLGFYAGSALSIGAMLFIVRLLRLPFIFAAGQLAADFGLDPRPVSRRLKAILGLEARRATALWLLSVLLFWALRLELWAWTLLTLAVGLALAVLMAARPTLWSPEKLRPAREGELPPALLAKLEAWAPQTGISSRSILISTSFFPELTPPQLIGLHGKQVKIPERALSAFPPREISLRTAAAVIGTLVKAPLKFLLLRACSLAVAVPLAAIMISTVGAQLWLYPVTVSPALITLLWAGLWLGHNLGDFAARLTRRALDAQLAAAASVLLKDEEAPAKAADTLAEKNLEEEAAPAWREIFRDRHTRRAFIAKVKFQQHLSKFTEDKDGEDDKDHE